MNRVRSLAGMQKDVLAIPVLFAVPVVLLAEALFVGGVLAGDAMERYTPQES